MKVGQQQLSFLCALLFAVMLGIVTAGLFPDGVPHAVHVTVIAATAGVLLLSARLVFSGSAWIWAAAPVCFFALGIVRGFMVFPIPADDISRHARETIRVSGILRETPQVRPWPQGGLRVRYLVDARRAGTEDVTGGLYMYATAQSASEVTARVGDRISARGRVLRIRGYQNPGLIDLAMLSRARGITARMSVGKEGVEVRPQAGGFLRAAENVRRHYRESMREAMPEADAAAIFAMVFGGYDGVRPELVEAFTATGLVHLLSVSGSHITLLAGLVAWLASAFSLRRGLAALLVGLAAFGYAALAGFVPPAVRAALMGGLSFFALASGREYDGRRILVVVALLMLLVSPLFLYDLSFLLSFAATAGLLFLSPCLRDSSVFARLPRLVRDGVALTLGAQLMTLPICAWYFHAVSLSSLLANLMVVPLLELLMVAALSAGLMALAFPVLARVVFAADSLLLGLSYEWTRVLAALPMSRVYLPGMGWGAAASYYVLLLFFAQPPERRRAVFRRLRALPWKPISVGLGLSVLTVLANRAMRPAEMTVHVIDTGQGDACLLVTPHGRAFMIDTGGSRNSDFDMGARVDVPYLLHYGIRELEGIFLTHAHEDHAAGAGAVIKNIPTARVFIGREGREAYRRSMKLSAKEMELSSFTDVREGTKFTLDGVTMEVLYAPDVIPPQQKTGNEVSIVYRVSYGKASFLFTGDLPADGEAELLSKGKDIHSTVLKVGHHGSKTSTTDAFLAAVSPKFGVICVGRDNAFGHPHPEVVEKIRRAGAKIYRTDQNGAIVFHTDGESMRVETYRSPAPDGCGQRLFGGDAE